MQTTLLIALGIALLLAACLVPLRRSRRRARRGRIREARIRLLAEGIAEEHAEGEDASSQVAALRQWAPFFTDEDWALFEETYRDHYDELTTRLSKGKAQIQQLEQTFRRNQETSRARLGMSASHRDTPSTTTDEDASPREDSSLAEFQSLMDRYASHTPKQKDT